MSAMSDPSRWLRPRQGWGAGTVTRRGDPAEPPPAGSPVPGRTVGGQPIPTTVAPAAAGDAAGAAGAPLPAPSDRRRLLLFGGTAGAVLVIGLVAVLAVTLRGGVNPMWDRPSGPVDVRPPLARACPGPTALVPQPTVTPPAVPTPGSPAPDSSAAPRTVDTDSGISYQAYGEPWQTWDVVWRAGTLEVPYRVGQHFVTEVYPGGTYHASILSAAVPAADNDALALDLECVGRQVAADVRAEYYPQPNQADPIRDERTTLGGRPAWVTIFRLHFDEPGLRATNELAAVATIDVGGPDAAILYISIPGTHRQWDYVVDEVLASVTVP